MRRSLLLNAKALCGAGLLADGVLRALRGGHGYRDTALDLLLLAHVMANHRGMSGHEMAATRETLERAERVGAQMLTMVGERELAAARMAAAGELRRRAFTLLAIAYDEARRAIVYLRSAEGDADVIAPPMRGRGRGGVRREGM